MPNELVQIDDSMDTAVAPSGDPLTQSASSFGTVDASSSDALTQSSATIDFTPTDVTGTGALVGLAAMLTMSETYELSETNALSETLVLAGVPTLQALHLATLSEVLGVSDTLTPIMLAALDDGFNLADAPTYDFSVLTSLVDGLVLSGAATTSLVAMAQVSEALALMSVAGTLQEGTITDTAGLIDAITAQVSAMEQIVAAAVFADTATGLALATVEVSETFDLDSGVTGLATLTAAVNDGLRFSIGFVFDDTPIIALSMNAATKGLSTYSQYPFNSMVEFNGTYYGAADGGLYELDGTDDDGDDIIWRIRTGMSNLGTGRNKAMDAAYLGFTANGRVALKCIVVSPSTGEKIVHWYELTETAAVTPRGRRLLVGRGLRSVYWGFEMTNVTAGDIELDIVELHPIVLDGRLS